VSDPGSATVAENASVADGGNRESGEPELRDTRGRRASDRTVPDGGTEEVSSRGPYVESTIIMTTVRVVAPFIFTLGLFVMFHGASSPGGGFQGGAIASAMLLMFAIAFGIAPTREWLNGAVLTAAIAGGVLVFALIGLVPLALGAPFLEYSVYPIPHASKYGIELVELAIGGIVAGVLTGLFFLIAAGFDLDSEEGEPR
jgi:multicomponent Na+:H+ antiporter subunit B